jgi:ammonium transporter, Amt family
VAFVYPIVGSWKWGGGWLDENGLLRLRRLDAGALVGGWGALAGVILLLGPRSAST